MNGHPRAIRPAELSDDRQDRGWTALPRIHDNGTSNFGPRPSRCFSCAMEDRGPLAPSATDLVIRSSSWARRRGGSDADRRRAGGILFSRFISCGLALAFVLVAGNTRAHAPYDEDLVATNARIAADPKDGDAYLWRAELKFQMGDPEGARSDLAWAGLLDPARVEVPLAQMSVAARMGDLRWAREVIAQYLESYPSRAAELVDRANRLMEELASGWVDAEVLGPLRAELLDHAMAANSQSAPTLSAQHGIATVTRGPYIMSAAATSLVVRWRTDIPTDSRVRYGAMWNDLNSSRGDTTLTTEHEMLVNGLDPDTRYYYAVGTSTVDLTGGDSFTYFTTSPTPGAEHVTRFWILGDSGAADQNARAVRNAFLAWHGGTPLDCMLLLGDAAYNAGTDIEHQAALFDMYPSVLRRATLWTTRGNHDVLYSGGNNDYYDFFTLPRQGQCGGEPSLTESYYSLDWGNTHFICLDSEGSSRVPSGAMLTWLSNDLAQNSRDWTVCFFHHPPYTKGSHDSDIPTDSGGRMIEMRQYSLPILDAYGVDLVLSGHSHGYERSFMIDGHYGFSWSLTPDMIVDGGDGDPLGDGAYEKLVLGPAPHSGTVYNVTGCSSKTQTAAYNHPVMVTSQMRLGSDLLEINGAQLEMSFVDTFGVVQDHFVIVKLGPASVDDASPISSAGISGAPNPFTGNTRLSFDVPSPARARVTLLDALGRRLRVLAEEDRPSGPWTVLWDGADDRGRTLPPGVYFVVFEAGDVRRTEKVIRIE